MKTVGTVPALLVRIDASEPELLSNLEATSTAGGDQLQPARDAIEFRTVVATQEQVERMARDASRQADLEGLVRAAPHFVVPLRKRKGVNRPFAERIFVGRAYGTDIVLRHAKVSKSHAWVERDEDGVYFVCDAGSKNGTMVNEAPLEPRAAVALEHGDRIRFGTVEAVYCRPESIFELLQRH